LLDIIVKIQSISFKKVCLQINARILFSKRKKKVFVIPTISIGIPMRETKMIASAASDRILNMPQHQVTIHIKFSSKRNQFTRVEFLRFQINKKLKWDSARVSVRMMKTVKPLSMTLTTLEMFKTVRLFHSTVTLVMVTSKLFASPKTMVIQLLFQKLLMKQSLLKNLLLKLSMYLKNLLKLSPLILLNFLSTKSNAKKAIN
jgi:hypothetical protein